HRLGQILIAEMLLHQVFFLRGHWHPPAEGHFDIECIVHGFKFGSVQSLVHRAGVGRHDEWVLTTNRRAVTCLRPPDPALCHWRRFPPLSTRPTKARGILPTDAEQQGTCDSEPASLRPRCPKRIAVR